MVRNRNGRFKMCAGRKRGQPEGAGWLLCILIQMETTAFRKNVRSGGGGGGPTADVSKGTSTAAPSIL